MSSTQARHGHGVKMRGPLLRDQLKLRPTGQMPGLDSRVHCQHTVVRLSLSHDRAVPSQTVLLITAHSHIPPHMTFAPNAPQDQVVPQEMHSAWSTLRGFSLLRDFPDVYQIHR